ncbi:MAG: hypothetical protein K2O29_03815, partial [Ruminococcus sp.]|nr:hypothetical protein [Ruminococcus sp.]
MSKISMDEKLKDLKKVIFKLSEIGCMLSTENEKQSAMLIAKDKHISDLEEQVNKLYADNDETMKSNTDYYAYENQSAFNIVLLEIDSDGSPTGTMYYK